ncbi:MAG: hypothetical protein QM708_14235 [Propioniciclava sp.]|uniref:hypothetical protein n=1 Tax=Propioniciclava sp. TaxID=2038686 RepID=UPI0039E58CED
MSHLALIPLLESLPGWPQEAEPAVLDILVVILGIPLGITAVITVLFMGPHWLRRSQGKSAELERA